MEFEVGKIDPRRSALLVMDYQAAILDRLEDSGGVVAQMVAATATARAAGMTVAYVRVAFTDEDYARIPPSNKSFAQLAAQPGFMHDSNQSTQVDPQLAPTKGDIVVRKVRVGAFSTTDLAAQLQSRGIDTLVLGGISTSGVVLSTVRDAADKDFGLFVLSDACADFDAEVHRVLMEKVFPRQAEVITVAEFAQQIPSVG